MDALTRYHRMRGDNTLWQPGTDHAGIATQIVVERQLDGQGISRHDLGREKFLEKVWEWKEYSGNTITRQMRRLGTSPDWTRERFTMDAGLSKIVTETFVRLYNEGLIYRGKRLVNWDPALHTAVSDLEVVSEEEAGFMWHIRYPLADGSGSLVVATTRPETMLGDTAVMVHPEDERYKDMIGKTVKLPLTDREIPIIADAYVDLEFGTGCVKVTPGARLQRLRRRATAQAADHFDPHAGCQDQRERAREISRHGPLRRAQGRRRRSRSAGRSGQDRQAHAEGASRRPHRRRHRADAHRSVVRRHEQNPAPTAPALSARRSNALPREKSSSCRKTGSTPTTSG